MILTSTPPRAARPVRRRIAGFARALVMIGSAVLGTARAAHAVTVSPTALFIDNRTRSGVITLYNSGSLPEEITLGFAFGYPRSDSTGNVTVTLLDSVPNGEPSNVPWLRAFPRQLRLEPGQRQTVRVMVNPPAGLADGEYWGRLTVTSRGGQPPIEQRQGAITMQIALQTMVIVAVNYRNGAVNTGVQLQSATARHVGDSVHVMFDLTRTGNAAYLGHAKLELVSSTGDVIAATEDDIAVYHTLRRRLSMVVPPTARLAGASVRFTLLAERPEMPDAPLPAAAVRANIAVTQ